MRIARILIFILVLLGLLWLVVLLFQRVFLGGSGQTTDPHQNLSLVSYANTNAVTSMYIGGPIVVNQNFTAYRISVDRTQTMVQVMRGYDEQVVAQQAFPNNTTGYQEFLSALDRVGFTQGKTNPELQDYSGSCPFGNRYVFTLTDGQEKILNFWITNCSGGGGTYQGHSSQTRRLFLRQIPTNVLNQLTNAYPISF